jgi:hypothetical protein
MPHPEEERVSLRLIIGAFIVSALVVLLSFSPSYAGTITPDCISCHNSSSISGTPMINTTAFSYPNASHYYINEEARLLAQYSELNTSALYDMDEGDGGDLNDSSSNNNDAKIWGDTRLLMHFDEGAGTMAYDETAYNNSGILKGDTFTSDTPSGSGRAIQFNGSGQYVNISDSSSLVIQSPLTWGTWIKWNGSALDNAIFQKGSSHPTGYSTYIDSSGFVNCFAGTAPPFAGVPLPSTNHIATQAWTHIVCMWNRTYTILYINGNLNATLANMVFIPAATNPYYLYVGHDGTGNINDFNGSIDEPFIINRTLSPSEISTLYNALLKPERRGRDNHGGLGEPHWYRTDPDDNP